MKHSLKKMKSSMFSLNKELPTKADVGFMFLLVAACLCAIVSVIMPYYTDSMSGKTFAILGQGKYQECLQDCTVSCDEMACDAQMILPLLAASLGLVVFASMISPWVRDTMMKWPKVTGLVLFVIPMLSLSGTIMQAVFPEGKGLNEKIENGTAVLHEGFALSVASTVLFCIAFFFILGAKNVEMKNMKKH